MSDQSTDRVLYLARGKDCGYGYLWPERADDGPHDTPEGVARAARIYGELGYDEQWVMVEVHPIPPEES